MISKVTRIHLTEKGYSCVYMATFPNGKKYIGLTSNSFHERKLAHLALARKGEGNLFHRAIRKYGETSIKWEVLQNGLSVENSKKVEQWMIELFNSHRSASGYNLTRGGECGYKDIKPFKVYKTNGTYVGTYTNISYAARELNICAKNLQRVLVGRVKTHAGYTATRGILNLTVKGIHLNRNKEFNVFTPSGELLGTWKEANACSRVIGVSAKVVRTALANPTRKSKSGYTFRYKEEN